MSKSKGNVVDPDDMMLAYGADALRLYETFVAPPEKEVEWTDSGLEGSFRFLTRVWRLVESLCELLRGSSIDGFSTLKLNNVERDLRRKTHDTIRRVTSDIDPRVHLNTAVSALMELVNELYVFCDGIGRGPITASNKSSKSVRRESVQVVQEAVESLVLMLSPFTPHIAEELWEMLGHTGGVTAAGWPTYDEAVAKLDEIIVPVQVNGKVRARLTVQAGLDDSDLEALALADSRIVSHVQDKVVQKVVVVHGKLVSIVAV